MMFLDHFMKFHDTRVHCWIWKIVINAWVNMFEFFFSDQVIICLVIHFISFGLIVFYVLLFCINKVSILMNMFHMVNMVIGVIKLDSVNF